MILLLFLAWQLWFLLHILWWTQTPPQSSAFMQERIPILQQQGYTALRYHWVDYPDISVHLKRAVLAAEDTHFSQHSGFDWHGIKYAIQRNWQQKRLVAGGSSISQQLAKNLFLSSERSLWRKPRILELYLNVAEWGNGIYGIQAAAKHYFHTDAARLNRWQAARLAAMLPNPRVYQTLTTSGLKRKTSILLQRMAAIRLPKTE